MSDANQPAPAPPRILIIAGSDSSGGAGIQADIKTVTMLGGYAMTAITALTAQNTTGVAAVHFAPADFVAQQIHACISDIGVDAVKIGMLGTPDIARAVTEALQSIACPVVFDPVMVATSGGVLADARTIALFADLMDEADLVTPNLPELAALTGMDVETENGVLHAATELTQRHGAHVLAKGGHATGERLTDLLVRPNGDALAFEDARIETLHTHGTGCTLASAIAALLGHGQSMEHSVRLARRFVRSAIALAPGFGSGHGPLGQHAVRSLEQREGDAGTERRGGES
jgi:hydroxymethylpyrimidine/phosphomethylpyrimidine kinase